MKVCIKCRVEKLEEEFYIRPDNQKRQNTCKQCRIEYATAHRKDGKKSPPHIEDSPIKKHCSCCRETKSLNHFIERSGRPGTYFNRCKSCKRELERKRRFEKTNKRSRLVRDSDMAMFAPVRFF